ncbi:MAG: hypothetical protein GF334_09585 [Candidatus Altiarchaeales archaeon]|nr:hypothetical protein [Candidatus Altiarchaeales archaeon]
MVSERLLADVIVLRGLGYTQKEVAGKLGLTQNQVSYYLSEVNQKARERGDYATFLSIACDGFLPDAIQTINKLEKII